jgi:hypothetical protein
MCLYNHAIVGMSPYDYGREMVGYICRTHTVSVTYRRHRLGVTAAGMIEGASLLEATEGKRPIAAAASTLDLASTPPQSINKRTPKLTNPHPVEYCQFCQFPARTGKLAIGPPRSCLRLLDPYEYTDRKLSARRSRRVILQGGVLYYNLS